MIAVVIPCYRVREQILAVLGRIGPECDAIYVVDDACPESTGAHVEKACRDPRVRVISLPANRGVGGATIAGYRRALEDGATVLVKIDGDGQMDPRLIPMIVRPIVLGEADYAKGNRFFDLSGLGPMPALRVFGNSILSFASKLSSGYWDLFDPTNGFTALHAAVAKALPLDRVSQGYFFESDLLFRLGLLRAVVRDVPMPAVYRDERSSLSIARSVFEFPLKHLRNTVTRVFYSYYLRNFNIASIEILLGSALLLFGAWFGVTRWAEGSAAGTPVPSGTVMLAALPVILGAQLLLAFFSYDLSNVPRDVLHRRLATRAGGAEAAAGTDAHGASAGE